jgi:type IV pilus assembly protein PilY1
VLASGYNNDDGKAYFFFLNPRTGALLETVATSTGTTAAPLNMAHITAFIPSSANFQADAIYGGDLQGNIWRLDLTGTSGSYSVPTKIASLTNNSGVAEPVTTRPLVEADTDTSRRYVLVGTGRLLADSDISSTSQQTFYAIRDGSNTYGSFYTSSTLPSGATFPVTRTQLQAVSSLLTGISSTSSSSTVMGYYYDLTTDASTGIASRISIQPSFNAGVVAFATTLPSGSACSPSGTSTIYALSMTSGKSVLVDNSGNIVASVASSASVRNLTFYSVSGTTRLLAGTSSGTVTKVSGNFNSAGTLKRLNWRVIPVVE